jgi:undecaprenyl-diphosphatase
MDFLIVHRRLFILNALSVVLFSLLAFSVLAPDARMAFDVWLGGEGRIFFDDTLKMSMLYISAVMSPIFLSTATVCLYILLTMYKKRAEGLLLLGAMTGGLVSVDILKKAFDVARPLTDIAAYGLSFPSGHATVVAIFVLTILFVVEKHIHSRTYQAIVALISVSLVLLTGFSRIYLGVHWLSDVLAGFALGMFWVTLSFIILYRSQYHYGTTYFKRS